MGLQERLNNRRPAAEGKGNPADRSSRETTFRRRSNEWRAGRRGHADIMALATRPGCARSRNLRPRRSGPSCKSQCKAQHETFRQECRVKVAPEPTAAFGQPRRKLKMRRGFVGKDSSFRFQLSGFRRWGGNDATFPNLVQIPLILLQDIYSTAVAGIAI